MTTKSQQIPIVSTLWIYLNQPLFNTDSRFILNPLKFTLPYKIRLLERCLTKDCDVEGTRQELELCWQKSK